MLQWTVVWTLLATTLQVYGGRAAGDSGEPKDLRFKPLIRTIFILPWAVPGFVTILVFAGMFNDSFGVINNAILSFFGISPKAWLTDPFWTKTALIMMQTWLGFPFVFAMTTGVLQAIATICMKRRRWTAPAPLPVCAPSLCRWCCTRSRRSSSLSTPSTLITSTSFICLTTAVLRWRGSNAGGTDILVSWIYKLTMSSSQYAIAATITILLSIFVVGLALWQFRATKSFKNDDMA